MIGNDVIDFSLAREINSFRRSRLYRKLFSAKEQEALENAEDRDLLFWKFWAMKEAAYKAHQRRFGLPRSFEPVQFQCSISAGKEAVHVGELQYNIQISVFQDHLQCIALGLPGERFQQEISPTSAETKEKLFAAVSTLKAIPKEKIYIEKDKDFIPHLMYRSRPLNCSFSLSHHGNFSAYALSLTNC